MEPVEALPTATDGAVRIEIKLELTAPELDDASESDPFECRRGELCTPPKLGTIRSAMEG